MSNALLILRNKLENKFCVRVGHSILRKLQMEKIVHREEDNDDSRRGISLKLRSHFCDCTLDRPHVTAIFHAERECRKHIRNIVATKWASIYLYIYTSIYLYIYIHMLRRRLQHQAVKVAHETHREGREKSKNKNEKRRRREKNIATTTDREIWIYNLYGS